MSPVALALIGALCISLALCMAALLASRAGHQALSAEAEEAENDLARLAEVALEVLRSVDAAKASLSGDARRDLLATLSSAQEASGVRYAIDEALRVMRTGPLAPAASLIDALRRVMP